MGVRIEKDSLGEIEIPQEAYYGIQTQRDINNVQIVKRGINRQMIKALSIIKKSAALANVETKQLDKAKGEYISLACDEILNGRLHGQFITDLIQGASGAGMNVNANEIIVNRANELAGYEKGKYEYITRSDVNLNQMAQTVIPIAGKIATIKLLKKLFAEMKKLISCLESLTNTLKEKNIGIWQECSSVQNSMDRSYKLIQDSMKNLYQVHLGLQFNLEENELEKEYCKKWVEHISKESTEKFVLAKDSSDNFQDMEALNLVSSSLASLATNTSKMANDFMFLSSSFGHRGFKVILPTIDNYSENLYQDQILEVVQQVSIFAYGCSASISKAVEMSYVKSHAYEPVILFVLFDMITYLRRSVRMIREKVLENISIQELK